VRVYHVIIVLIYNHPPWKPLRASRFGAASTSGLAIRLQIAKRVLEPVSKRKMVSILPSQSTYTVLQLRFVHSKFLPMRPHGLCNDRFIGTTIGVIGVCYSSSLERARVVKGTGLTFRHAKTKITCIRVRSWMGNRKDCCWSRLDWR
jgi:hypothetical protein